MEAGEYCLTCVTCFLACRLKLDAVAGLLWISWCVLGGGSGFFCVCVCFFFRFFSFERTRPAASMKPLLASTTSLLVYTILQSSNNSCSRDQGCVFYLFMYFFIFYSYLFFTLLMASHATVASPATVVRHYINGSTRHRTAMRRAYSIYFMTTPVVSVAYYHSTTYIP